MLPLAETNKRKRVIVNIIYWALIAALVYMVFKYLIGLIWPFFLAFIFSWILRPAIRLMTEKWRMRYNLSAVICLVLFFLIVGGIVTAITVKIISSASDAVATIPSLYTDTIEPALENGLEKVEELAQRVSPNIYSMVDDSFANIVSSISSAVAQFSVKAVTVISGWVTKLPSRLLSAVICVISTVFMTMDFPRMTAFVLRQIPDKTKRIITETMDSLKSVVVRFGKGYVIIMGITFAEILLGLLAVRQENAVLIAAAIAVFDIFPVVGAGMVLAPWAIITLMSGAYAKGAGLLALWIIVIVVRQIIEPKIVGRSVGLHPLVTLMSMFVGTKLFGGVGLFGLPITCAIVKSLNDGDIIHVLKKEEPAPQEGSEGEKSL